MIPVPSDHASSISGLWEWYADRVYGDYSPLNAALARTVVADRALLDRVLASPPHAHEPNMLLAAIHYVVLGGTPHPLAASYERFDPAVDLAPLVRDFCTSNWDEISGLLAGRRIQTNECGRSAALALAIAEAAARLGEPVAVVDAGASAGLNLLFDEYLLDYGTFGSLGPGRSPVRIACQVRSPNLAIPSRLPAVEARVGIDQTPVDLTDADNVRWLLACTWPGTGRHERTAAAIRMAAARPSLVRPGDMVADLGETIGALGDRPTIVVTSWSYSYLPLEQRAAFQQALADAAQTRPVGWVCADVVGVADLFAASHEPDPADLAPSVLGMALFDRTGLIHSGALGFVHSHGAWIDWFG